MEALTARQRKYLRSNAHHLDPVVQVGKGGVSEGLLAEVDKALSQHELIKIKFVDHKDERKELSEEIAEASAAWIAGVVGNVCILYRPNPDPAKRNFSLP